MLKKSILIVILLGACLRAHAQHEPVKPKDLPDVLPTMNYKAAMTRAEAGDVRAIREAAILIYLQSPYGDPAKDTSKGTWDITPQIEAKMNKWTVEQAMHIHMLSADAAIANGNEQGGGGIEACVWKSRMLKVVGNKEIDDQANFRLKPQPVVRDRTYWTELDPCVEGEDASSCARKFRFQAERDIVFSKLNKADRNACIQRIVNWHLTGGTK